MEPRGLGLTSPTPTNYWPLFAQTLQLLYSFKTKCLHSIILSSSLLLKSKKHIFTLHIHRSVTDQLLCTFTSNSINKFSLKNVILYHFMYKNCRVTPIKHILIQKTSIETRLKKSKKWDIYDTTCTCCFWSRSNSAVCKQDSVGPPTFGENCLFFPDHWWPWPIYKSKSLAVTNSHWPLWELVWYDVAVFMFLWPMKKGFQEREVLFLI